jgi:hypothetical protein
VEGITVIGVREGRRQALWGVERRDVHGHDTLGPLGKRRGIMPLLHVVGVLVVIGIRLWLLNTYIPMDAKIKSILNIVVVVAVILWLLRAFGILGSLSEYRIGK